MKITQHTPGKHTELPWALAALDYTDYVKAQVPTDTKERIAQ